MILKLTKYLFYLCVVLVIWLGITNIIDFKNDYTRFADFSKKQQTHLYIWWKVNIVLGDMNYFLGCNMYENSCIKNHEALTKLLEGVKDRIFNFNHYNKQQLLYLNFILDGIYLYQNIHTWNIDFVTEIFENLDRLELPNQYLNIDLLNQCPHWEYVSDTTNDLFLHNGNNQFNVNNPLFRRPLVEPSTSNLPSSLSILLGGVFVVVGLFFYNTYCYNLI